jgi:hypothetical protein
MPSKTYQRLTLRVGTLWARVRPRSKVAANHLVLILVYLL